MKKLIIYILPLILAALLQSCRDDFEYNDPSYIPDGITEVEAELNFMPMSEALTGENDEPGSRATQAPDGDATNRLDDVCLLFYYKDGSLARIFSKEDFTSYSESDIPRQNSDADNGIMAETATKRAKFKVRVPYGEYSIYAVANLGHSKCGHYSTATTTLKELETTYADSIKTIEGLKSIRFRWDDDNIRNNSQMFGFVTLSASDRSEHPIVLNRDGVTLYSWVRRVASKVTITFDGSGLRDGIRVYFRQATIRDVPASVSLGMPNTVTKSDEMLPTTNHHLDYGAGNDYTSWPFVSKEQPEIKVAAKDGILPSHDEKAKALYLFENQQGNYANDPQKQLYDKRQNTSVTYGTVRSADEKDNVPYGSFIQVEAYYRSTAANNVTSGKIFYRFMLGQDIYYDFNTNRNCHYKLTLRLKGNANDADWHITYFEDYPDIMTDDVFYISYLYNRLMTMPVHINEGSKYKLKSLDAEIISNNWAPDDPFGDSRPTAPSTDGYKFTWNYDYYISNRKKSPAALKNEYVNPETDPTYYNTDLWHGFLSLRKTRDMTILSEVTSKNHGEFGSNPYTRQYYEGTGEYQGKHNHRGKRSYQVPNAYGVTEYPDAEDGDYSVEYNDTTYLFKIPCFTRAKEMSTYLAYTANNPYPFPRLSVVRFKAVFEDRKDPSNRIVRYRRVTVKQVERIENPKAIWRRHDKTQSFQVELKTLDPADMSKFISIKSDGPWRAEIVGDNSGWIRLNGGVKTIYGSSKSTISFEVAPASTCGKNEVRYGGIRISYNNYSCDHLIFLRQGYASTVMPGLPNTKWSTFALYKKDQLTKSPLSSGSYFRYGNLNQPIREDNNDREGYGLGKIITDKELNLAGGGTTTWRKMNNNGLMHRGSNMTTTYNGYVEHYPGNNATAKLDVDYFGKVTIGKKTYHVAEYNDMEYLAKKTQMAYGVLYGDGATKTGETVDVAFGFTDGENKHSTSENGMRGVICYAYDREHNTGNVEQVFFPITKSGHGRRNEWITGEGDGGTLRYGDVNYALPLPRVMVFDLYQAPGAMYWVRKAKRRGHFEGEYYPCYAFDLNYYTFKFGTYHWNCVGYTGKGSDALLIKWIEE